MTRHPDFAVPPRQVSVTLGPRILVRSTAVAQRSVKAAATLVVMCLRTCPMTVGLAWFRMRNRS